MGEKEVAELVKWRVVVLSGQCCNEITVKNSYWYWNLPATSPDLSNTCPPGSNSLLTSVTLLHQLVSNISNFQNHVWKMPLYTLHVMFLKLFWQRNRLSLHLLRAQETFTQISLFFFFSFFPLKPYLIIDNGCMAFVTTKENNNIEKLAEVWRCIAIETWNEPCFITMLVHYRQQSEIFP